WADAGQGLVGAGGAGELPRRDRDGGRAHAGARLAAGVGPVALSAVLRRAARAAPARRRPSLRRQVRRAVGPVPGARALAHHPVGVLSLAVAAARILTARRRGMRRERKNTASQFARPATRPGRP